MRLFLTLLLLPSFTFAQELCEDYSDQLCREVWSKKNRGNVTYGKNNIFLGESSKSEVNQSVIIDGWAWVESEKSLPDDIRPVLSPILKELKKKLEKQKLGKLWKRELRVVNMKIGNALTDVARRRTLKRRPDLKIDKKRSSDLTFKETQELYKDWFNVQSEVLEARYLKHENWVRVQSVFEQVRSDLAKVISQFPIDKKIKIKMSKKLMAAKLTLPYQDPKRFGADELCSSYKVNAYYKVSRNAVTVCIGYINTYQSDGKIYKTLAHELGHAFDPATLAIDEYTNTDMAKLLKRVSDTNGSLSCKDWESSKKKVFTQPERIYQLSKKISKLGECFVDRSNLKKLTLKSLQIPSEAMSSQSIAWRANRNAFTLIAQDRVFKFEELIENEFFEKPSRLMARFENDFIHYENKWGFFDPYAVFFQEYQCRKEKKARNRAKVFEQALEEVKRLKEIQLQYYWSFEGRESTALQEYDLAKPSFEAWADWTSQKAFSRYLKGFSKDEKKEMIMAVNASYCQEAGLNTVAPDLVRIEKDFANEEHPEVRSRRLAIFTEDVAEILSCKRGKEVQLRSQKCELK